VRHHTFGFRARFSGVVERFPQIRWILGISARAIPYLASRLDRATTRSPDCRQNIAQPPTVYLKRYFYYDTVNFDPRAIELAISFAGEDHILAAAITRTRSAAYRKC